MAYIASIVEGHGENQAVPKLLHRIAQDLEFPDVLRINPPIRIKSGSFLNDLSYFQKYVSLAAAKAAQESGFVLILLDCDDDCPAQIGPRLLSQAKSVRSDVNYIVALAYREFESWFIAAISSLGGHHGIPAGLTSPQHLEEIRDAKGWLGQRMESTYDPIVHQYKMVQEINLNEAKQSSSFLRFYNKIRDELFDDSKN